MAVDSKTIVLTPVTGTSTLELDVVNLDSPAYSNVRLSPVSNTTVTALGLSDYVVEATFDSHGHGTATTAAGASTSAATASASGTGTPAASGSTGVTVVSAAASASGTSTVSASGTGLKPASASASSTSSAAAAGGSTGSAVGSAVGVGSAASTGLSVTSGAGLASGLGSVASVGRSTAASTASASGTGTPSSTGRSIFTATASATGVSSVSAAGRSTFSAVAVSTGSTSVSSVGGGIAAAQAAATGTSSVDAIVTAVYEAAFESTGVSAAESEGTAVTWSVAYASGTGELLFEAEVLGSVAESIAYSSALADTQFLYSLMSDGVVSRGGWTTETGGTTDLYLSIDEAEPDDADYIRSVTDPVGDSVELSLGDPPHPVGDEFVVEYRYGKGGTTSVDIRVNLRCEGDLIASWFHANVTTDMTTVTQTLSPSEVALIADPGALTVEIIANP